MNVIETSGLGKCYGKARALHDVTLAVPEGSLTALVGPNGAGKSTLMGITAGLTLPTEGTATVLGGHQPGSPAALSGIAFLAQDAPVYRNLSVADLLHLTRNLNHRFDDAFARARLDGTWACPCWPGSCCARTTRCSALPATAAFLVARPRRTPRGS